MQLAHGVEGLLSISVVPAPQDIHTRSDVAVATAPLLYPGTHCVTFEHTRSLVAVGMIRSNCPNEQTVKSIHAPLRNCPAEHVHDGAMEELLQPKHAVSPRWLWYVPTPHAAHGVLGLLSVSALPVGHKKLLHAPVCPGGTNVPGLHAVHAVDALESWSVVPAAHANALHAPDCPAGT